MFHPFRRLTRVAVIAGAGAAAAYYFDPHQGPARRAELTDRLGPLAARLPGSGSGVGPDGGDGDDTSATVADRFAHDSTHGPGLEQRVDNEWRPDVPEPSADHSLEDKVRSQVLGQAEFKPFGVLVNDVGGVIDLRGEIADDQVREDLKAAVRGVPGVVDVHDLTHRPGEVAPNNAGTVTSIGHAPDASA